MLQTLIRARSKSVQMPLTGRNSRARLNSSTVRPRSRTSQRAAWSALRAAADQSTEHIRPEPVETPHCLRTPFCSLAPGLGLSFLFFQSVAALGTSFHRTTAEIQLTAGTEIEASFNLLLLQGASERGGAKEVKRREFESIGETAFFVQVGKHGGRGGRSHAVAHTRPASSPNGEAPDGEARRA